MKKLLLLAAFALCCINAGATHLMGGDLVVSHATGSDYTITLTHYRDTLGIPLYTTQPAYIYGLNTTTGDYVLTQSLYMNRNMSLSTLLVSSFPYGVEVGVYDTTISFTPGKYRILTFECCRNCAILNATSPCSEDMELYTDFEVYSTAANSTPDFLNMPIAHFPINWTTNYNPLPYDVDADSIAWTLNTPIGNPSGVAPPMNPTFTAVGGFTTPPSNTSGPFSMNPITGEITWSPSTAGNFIQSFIVQEYRNGVQIGSIVRDMQYVVTNDTMVSRFSNVTPYNVNTQDNYNYIYYTPGQPLTFKISGVTQTSGVTLSMESYGAPFKMANPATFSTATSPGSVLGTFVWTPPANFTRDQVVAFRLKDGLYANDFTLLLRKNPNPNSVSGVASDIVLATAYPNPAGKTINISLELQKDVVGNVVLYNAIGQQIKSIYSGILNRGKVTLTENIDIPAGTYFITINAGGNSVKTIPLNIQ